MDRLERIGVSLSSDLLSDFDKLIKKQGYDNRSQAIGDLIRKSISEQKLQNPKAQAFAAVCMVYDHHATKLMKKMTDLQHTHLLQTVCSTHVHLNEHDCMEVIVLKGQVSRINKLADNIISLKGGKLGKVNIVTAD